LGATSRTLGILIIALLLTGPFGLSEIRVISGRQLSQPSLNDYAQDWVVERSADIEKVSAQHRYPIFIVNADGGGIRAAWWSATLLGLIQDAAPDFARHIFAMTGASGGSLGIATFAAQQAQALDAPDNVCLKRGRRQCAEDVLGKDLLAPSLATMLTSDLIRSVVANDIWPVRFPFPPDRATALERAFEQVWSQNVGSTLFEDEFTRLWAGNRRLAVPLLMLNTTDAGSVRRFVVTPVATGMTTPERGDLLPLLGNSGLRLSTAIMLSARFPGVSPAGWLPADNPGQGYAIVDGGFVDNSGARSATEAFSALRDALVANKLAEKTRIIAIMIANDPLPEKPRPEIPGPGGRSGASTLASLIAPMLTLDRLRQTSTQLAKHTYSVQLCAAGGLVLDGFDLRKGRTAFPLGWMLASTTRAAMAEQQDAVLKDPGSDLTKAIRLAKDADAAIDVIEQKCPKHLQQ
jgi:Patatin-like phospholipase